MYTLLKRIFSYWHIHVGVFCGIKGTNKSGSVFHKQYLFKYKVYNTPVFPRLTYRETLVYCGIIPIFFHRTSENFAETLQKKKQYMRCGQNVVHCFLLIYF